MLTTHPASTTPSKSPMHGGLRGPLSAPRPTLRMERKRKS